MSNSTGNSIVPPGEEEVRKELEIHAERLAAKYGLDPGRVFHVLKRTAPGFFGNPNRPDRRFVLFAGLGEDHRGPIVTPNLEEALQLVPPTEALRLFEQEDLTLLGKRVDTLREMAIQAYPKVTRNSSYYNAIGKPWRTRLDRALDHLYEWQISQWDKRPRSPGPLSVDDLQQIPGTDAIRLKDVPESDQEYIADKLREAILGGDLAELTRPPIHVPEDDAELKLYPDRSVELPGARKVPPLPPALAAVLRLLIQKKGSRLRPSEKRVPGNISARISKLRAAIGDSALIAGDKRDGWVLTCPAREAQK